MAKKQMEKNVILLDTKTDSLIFGELFDRDNDTNTYFVKEHPEIEASEFKVDPTGSGGIIDVTDSFDSEEFKNTRGTLEMIENLFKKHSDFSLKDSLPPEAYKELKDYSLQIDRVGKEDPADVLLYVNALGEKLKDLDYRGEKYASSYEKDFSSRGEAKSYFNSEDGSSAVGKTIEAAGFEGFKETAVRERTEKDFLGKLVENVEYESKGSWAKGMFLIFGEGRNYTPADFVWVSTIFTGVKLFLKTDLKFGESMKIAAVMHPPFLVDKAYYKGKLAGYREDVLNSVDRWMVAKKDLEHFEKAYDGKTFAEVEKNVKAIENERDGVVEKIENNKDSILKNARKIGKNEKLLDTTEKAIENLEKEKEDTKDKDKLDRIEGRIEKLKDSAEGMKKNNVERQKDIDDKKEQNKELEKESKDLSDKIEKTKRPDVVDKKVEKALEKIEDKTNSLKKEFSEKEQLKDEKKELSKDKAEKEKQIGRLAEFKEDSKEVIEKNNEKIKNLNGEKSSVEGKIEETNEKIKELKSERDALIEKKDKSGADAKQKEIEGKIEKNNNRYAELANIEAKIEGLEMANNDYEQNEDEAKEKIGTLESEIEVIDKEISSKDKEISAVDKRIDKLEKDKAKIELSIEDSNPYDKIEARSTGPSTTVPFFNFSKRNLIKNDLKDLIADLNDQVEVFEDIEDDISMMEEVFEDIEKNGITEDNLEKFEKAKVLKNDVSERLNKAENSIEEVEKKMDDRRSRAKVDKLATRGHDSLYAKGMEKAMALKEALSGYFDKHDAQQDKQTEIEGIIESTIKEEMSDDVEKINDLNKEYKDGEITPEEYESRLEPLKDDLEKKSDLLKEKLGIEYHPIVETVVEGDVEDKDDDDDQEDSQELKDDHEASEDDKDEQKQDGQDSHDGTDEQDSQNFYENDLNEEDYEEDYGEEMEAKIAAGAEIVQATLNEYSKEKTGKNEKNNDKEEVIANGEVEAIVEDNKQEAQEPKEDSNDASFENPFDLDYNPEYNPPEDSGDKKEALAPSEVGQATEKSAEPTDEIKALVKENNELKKENSDLKVEINAFKKELEQLNDKIENIGKGVETGFATTLEKYLDSLKDNKERIVALESMLETKEAQHEMDKENGDNNIEAPNDIDKLVEKKVDVETVDKHNDSIKTRWEVEKGGTKLERVSMETEVDGQEAQVEITFKKVEGRAGSILFRSNDVWMVEGNKEMSVEAIAKVIEENTDGIEKIEFRDMKGDIIDVNKVEKEKRFDFLAGLSTKLSGNEATAEKDVDKTEDENEVIEDTLENGDDNVEQAQDAIDNAENINDIESVNDSNDNNAVEKNQDVKENKEDDNFDGHDDLEREREI